MKAIAILMTAAIFFASTASKASDLNQVKRFPFIRYQKVWQKTPAETEDVAVPNVYIVVGDEDPKVLEAISRISFFLGQWTDALGINPEMVTKNEIPRIVIRDYEYDRYSDKNLIVIGEKNSIARRLNLKCKKACLKVKTVGRRALLFAGGGDDDEIIKAIRILSDKILAFKVGAYRTFFSWVKLRGLIEHKETTSALELLQSPTGVHACGRNMSLAAPMIKRFPKKVKEIIQRRNRIMYKELPDALADRDIKRAKRLWMEATTTCFMCHKGIGIKRLRTYSPNPIIHSKHQRIARKFGLSCKDCHKGITSYTGY